MAARDQSRQRKEQVRAETLRIGAAAKLLVSDLNPSRVLQTILELSMQAADAHRGFLAMVEHDRGELSVLYTAGDGWNEQNRRLRLKVSEETGRGITSHVAATGKSYRSCDVTNDPY